jgi:hypothetical protein
MFATCCSTEIATDDEAVRKDCADTVALLTRS